MLLFKEKKFKTSKKKKEKSSNYTPGSFYSDLQGVLPKNVIQGTLESAIFLIITEDRQNNIFSSSYFNDTLWIEN